MLVEIVDDDLRVAVTLQIDDNAGVLGALVAHITDAGEDFLGHEFGDAFDQLGAVHIVGNLGDDDALAPALTFLDAHAATHAHGAATSLEIRANACHALDQTASREVRAFYISHEPFDGDRGIINLGADAVDALAEIVRRHVGRHTHSDACAAIDEEVWESCWKNGGLCAGLVVVRIEVDRAFVHVGHERGAKVLEAGLGVTHGRWRIAFHRAEVTLAVHEHVAHRPWLSHVNEGRVNRLVAVRVVVTHRFTDDLRALEVLAVWLDAKFVHRKKNAALRGLETIACIRQGARDDDGHRVVEERLRHLLGHIYEFDFFVLGIHGLKVVKLGLKQDCDVEEVTGVSPVWEQDTCLETSKSFFKHRDGHSARCLR